jgi:hypothetical protein
VKLVIALIVLLLTATSCDTPSTDELGRLVNTQTQATIAAVNLNSAKAEATTRADATRQYLILQGQQTRVASEAQQTQTIFTQRAHVTETGAAQNAQATATASSGNTTATAIAIQVTATAQSAQATTAKQVAQFTATANAVIVEATQASASATATANAANAVATRTSNSATATVIAVGVQTQIERENWIRTTEGAWSVFRIAVMIVILFIAGLFAYRAIHVFVLRRSAFRDANGELVLTIEGKDGQYHMARPDRMPSPLLQMTPANSQPYQISTPGRDAKTTMLAQGVSLVRATADVENHQAATRTVAALADENQRDEPDMEIQISKPMESRQLDLNNRPENSVLPMGILESGEPLYFPFDNFVHGLIGGASGMGKTNLLHAIIQMLVLYKSVEIFAFDGAGGIEFQRYQSRLTYIDDAHLVPALSQLLEENERRENLMKTIGANSLASYNLDPDRTETFTHRLLIIDELAEVARVSEEAKTLLETVSSTARKSGVSLISATQHPVTSVVGSIIPANAMMRVALSVSGYVNSIIILGSSGAEKLRGIPGRALVSYMGQIQMVQTFMVDLPKPPRLGAGQSSIEPVKEIAMADTGKISPEDLTDEVKQMVDWSLREGEGKFVVTRIAAALQMQTGKVTAAAQWLEHRGLLTPVLKDGSGQNLGRDIAPDLRSLFSV